MLVPPAPANGACAPQESGLALVYSLGLCVWHFVPQACDSHVRWCTALTINIIYASQPLATCESLCALVSHTVISCVVLLCLNAYIIVVVIVVIIIVVTKE